VASGFVDRFTPEPILVAGLLISTGGFVFLTGVSGHGDYASHVVPAMIILGIGMGMSFVPVTIAGTSGVAPEDSGLASGLLNTTQHVDGSLGSAAPTRRRGRPDGRAVVYALPRRAVLRIPRARGWLRPPCTHPPFCVTSATEHPRRKRAI
jgi:hypothetical protein